MTTCWILCDDGKMGTLNQCVGLAQAMGLKFTVKKLRPLFPWRLLPSWLWFAGLSAVRDEHGKRLSAPWPDIIISGGRRSALPAALIRKQTKGGTKAVHILNPQVPCHLFDYVLAPRHDELKAPNVITFEGALHCLDHAQMKKKAAQLKAWLPPDLPRPYTLVLIGGNNKYVSLDTQTLQGLAQDLKTCTQQNGGTVFIVPSRRSPSSVFNIFSENLKNTSHFFWTEAIPHSFESALGVADYILVTSDSISMAAEAVYTGTPTYIVELPGRAAPKFQRFHQSLFQAGMARPFNRKIEQWTYQPPPGLDGLAADLKKRLKIQ